MKKEEWKELVTKSCEDAGTYREFFASVIDTLASIMEMRDTAQEQFDISGGQTIITVPNSTGGMKQVKNPALVVLMDCNTQALQYWRDLGLTPAGYKRLNAEVVKEEKGSLEGLLEKMMDG